MPMFLFQVQSQLNPVTPPPCPRVLAYIIRNTEQEKPLLTLADSSLGGFSPTCVAFLLQRGKQGKAIVHALPLIGPFPLLNSRIGWKLKEGISKIAQQVEVLALGRIP